MGALAGDAGKGGRMSMETERAARRTGWWAGVTAFGLWGLLPVFWKQIDWLSPAQVVAMRAVCCVPVLVMVLLVRG